jgi:hypothetical protein
VQGAQERLKVAREGEGWEETEERGIEEERLQITLEKLETEVSELSVVAVRKALTVVEGLVREERHNGDTHLRIHAHAHMLTHTSMQAHRHTNTHTHTHTHTHKHILFQVMHRGSSSWHSSLSVLGRTYKSWQPERCSTWNRRSSTS